jgi:hypothetical protein
MGPRRPLRRSGPSGMLEPLEHSILLAGEHGIGRPGTTRPPAPRTSAGRTCDQPNTKWRLQGACAPGLPGAAWREAPSSGWRRGAPAGLRPKEPLLGGGTERNRQPLSAHTELTLWGYKLDRTTQRRPGSRAVGSMLHGRRHAFADVSPHSGATLASKANDRRRKLLRAEGAAVGRKDRMVTRDTVLLHEPLTP